MKKNNAILLIFFVSFFLVVPTAQAHVLVTDGSIGAVMHIDPDDDPVAGAQSSFFFEFKDKKNKFVPKNCNCLFVIKEAGTVIFTQPLFQNTDNPSLSNASVFYTFPKRDVYEVSVEGKPLQAGDFQPFTLTYDIRVDQFANTAVSNKSTLQLWITAHIPQIIGGMSILGFIVWFLWKRRIIE